MCLHAKIDVKLSYAINKKNTLIIKSAPKAFYATKLGKKNTAINEPSKNHKRRVNLPHLNQIKSTAAIPKNCKYPIAFVDSTNCSR